MIKSKFTYVLSAWAAIFLGFISIYGFSKNLKLGRKKCLNNWKLDNIYFEMDHGQEMLLKSVWDNFIVW